MEMSKRIVVIEFRFVLEMKKIEREMITWSRISSPMETWIRNRTKTWLFLTLASILNSKTDKTRSDQGELISRSGGEGEKTREILITLGPSFSHFSADQNCITNLKYLDRYWVLKDLMIERLQSFRSYHHLGFPLTLLPLRDQDWLFSEIKEGLPMTSLDHGWDCPSSSLRSESTHEAWEDQSLMALASLHSNATSANPPNEMAKPHYYSKSTPESTWIPIHHSSTHQLDHYKPERPRW